MAFSAADATFYPVYAQQRRLTGVILLQTSLNPLTGGLTTPSATISKDGGAFGATINAPVEIGTTGFFTLDLTVAEMTANTVVVNVTAANASAVRWVQIVNPIDLTEFTGRADNQTVLKPEKYWQQIWARFHNLRTMVGSNGLTTITQKDAATPMLTYSTSGQGTDTTTVGKAV